MATPYETAKATYEALTVKINAVLADAKPNITVDGVSIDRMGYYNGLLALQKAAREQMLAAQGPITVTSVHR